MDLESLLGHLADGSCLWVQVTVHIKGKTECFECTPKAAPKTYPICTLRNTPDKPIHCVVWAKDLLYARLFGRSDEVTGEGRYDPAMGTEAATEGHRALLLFSLCGVTLTIVWSSTGVLRHGAHTCARVL